MPARALISRASSCSAQNAYNPISALRAAFNQHPTVLRFPNRQVSKRSRWHQSPLRFTRALSTTRQPVNDPDNELAASNVRQFLQDKYSQRPLESRGGRKRKSAAAQNIIVRRVPVGPRIPNPTSRVNALGETAVEGQGSSQDSPSNATQNQINEDPAMTWQHRMQEIATTAGELAKLPDGQSPSAEVLELRRQSLDYLPRAIPPRRSPLSERLPPPWALEQGELANLSSEDILSQEIERFSKYWELAPGEQFARRKVIQYTRHNISRFFSDEVTTSVAGSDPTGLSMITSDINLRIMHHGSLSEEELEKQFRKLWYYLQNSKDYMCVTMRYAHYPMIYAQHIQTGIDVQIVSAPSTAPQQRVVKNYLKDLPHLRSLYRILHATLSMRGLIDVYKGGIGSYGLFMMIVASITRPSTQPAETLLAQLLRFLEFYSHFDTTKYGISVDPAKLYKKHDGYATPDRPSTLDLVNSAYQRDDSVRAGQWAIGQRRLYQPYLLSLQDPVVVTNDLGRKSNAIKHLLATIDALRMELQQNLARGPQVYEENGGTMLAPFLGRCHEVYADRRRKLEGFGAREEEKQRAKAEQEEKKNDDDVKKEDGAEAGLEGEVGQIVMGVAKAVLH